MMLDAAGDQAFSLIVTTEGSLQIELGCGFCDDYVEDVLAAAEVVLERLHLGTP